MEIPKPKPLKKNLESIVKDFERYTADLELPRFSYEEGEPILEEGVANDRLHLIVEGQVDMYRRSNEDRSLYVDSLQTGGFLGLLSFWSDAKTFTHSKARTRVTCIQINRAQFEDLVKTHPQASLSLYSLMANSMADRYRHMVTLNIAVNHLTQQLESDRTELRKTVRDLEETRKQLVHKERLAMLGQLLAGIAHEINNPGTALKHSAEELSRQIPERFESGKSLSAHREEALMLAQGLASRPANSAAIRERMEALQDEFPNLPRSLLRKIQLLSSDAISEIRPLLIAAGQPAARAKLDEKLAFFSIGSHLHSIQLSVNRIASLIKGLKSYGRPVQEKPELQPLNEIILNTVTLLNHRLKYYAFDLDLDPFPPDWTSPSDLNQILTNLLINACEATPEGGKIRLSARLEEESLAIQVEDSGTGIPEAILGRIFEPNVTTKNNSAQFGLGLGLAISTEIAKRYGGELAARNRPEGGACFTLRLPRKIRIL